MIYPSITKYKEALLAAEDNFDKLRALRPVKGANGQPYMDSGNFAVVFKMTDGNRNYAVKCFTRDQPGRDGAYRKISDALRGVRSDYLVNAEYMEKELFVDMGGKGDELFPVLKMDWVEGRRLDDCLRDADAVEKATLAGNYCRMARWLLHQPFAHGDLKPDNIIVRADGSIFLLDYDGMYVPAMRGEKPRELGTDPYRHRSRDEGMFNEHIDDYPAVLIALLLRAAAIDPALDYGEMKDAAGKPGFIGRFGAMTGDARMAFLLAAYHAVLQYGGMDARMADMLLSYGDDIEAARRMAAGVAAPEPPVIRTPAKPQKAPAKPRPNTINGHEYVDLGLSVKWATCNVGASSPEDYGDYYAWGETKTKSRYDWGNCETLWAQIGDIGGTSRDVARVKWGGPWRLPTVAECDELIANCDYEWTRQTRVWGGKFTSRKNGNSVFFPAAGWRDGSSPNYTGSYGYYWSSTPYESDSQIACYLYFSSVLQPELVLPRLRVPGSAGGRIKRSASD